MKKATVLAEVESNKETSRAKRLEAPKKFSKQSIVC